MASAGSPRRAVLWMVLRSSITAVGLLAAYTFFPIGAVEIGPLAYFILGAAVFGVSLASQLRAIRRSDTPVLRMVEAIAFLLPFTVIVFASVYLVASDNDPAAFSEVLGKVDAMYFSVTVLSTVGFGDIVAVSDPARVLVTLQMLVDIVLLAATVRALTLAVQSRKATAPRAQA